MRATNVAAWRSFSVAVSANTLSLQLNATSSRQKGVMSYLVRLYYPGQIIKNYVIMIMSHLAQRNRYPEAVSTLEIFRNTWREVAFT